MIDTYKLGWTWNPFTKRLEKKINGIVYFTNEDTNGIIFSKFPDGQQLLKRIE